MSPRLASHRPNDQAASGVTRSEAGRAMGDAWEGTGSDVPRRVAASLAARMAIGMISHV